MSDNPYASPTVASQKQVELEPVDGRMRATAVTRIRWSILPLAAAAVLNWFCFHVLLTPNRFADGSVFHYGSPSHFGAMLVNATLTVALLAIVYFFGIRLFEGACVMLHYLFGRGVPRHAWLESGYDSLKPLPLAAVFGAVCWIGWCILFYFTDAPPIIFSNLLAFCGHIIAAAVYLPLLYRWWRLRRDAASGDAVKE